MKSVLFTLLALATGYSALALDLNFTFTSPTCTGFTDGTATVVATGGTAPYAYAWSNGQSGMTNLGITSGIYTCTVTDANGQSTVGSVNVTAHAPLLAQVQVQPVKCHGTASGVMFAAASGGFGNYTYVWDNGSTDPVRQNVPFGTYYVTVSDQAGCSAVGFGNVTEPLPLTNTIVNITPACGNNGSVTVQPAGGVPPYNVVWNGGQYTGTTVNNLAPGQYYVCTFDANQCQLDIILNVPGAPGLNVNLVSEKATCTGVNNGTATAIVSGGSGSYSYAWSNGAAPVAALNGLAAGTTLTVTVTDLVSGCNGTDQILIETHEQISIQVTDVDVDCASSPAGSASVVALSGTQPVNFAWTMLDGSVVNSSSISGLTSGAYAVTATDAQGCTAIGVADINATQNANAQIALSTLYCEGNSVLVQFNDQSNPQGSAISNWNWNVQWTGGAASFTTQNSVALDIPANSTGTATLNVTLANGCSGTTTLPFSVGEDPEVSVNALATGDVCAGGPTTIQVTGSLTYGYQWSPSTGLTLDPNNPLQVLANPSTTTNYTLVATNGGCADTVNVLVEKLPVLTVSLANQNVQACAPEASLQAALSVPANNVNIAWLNAAGDTLGTATNLTVPATSTATPYTVVVSNAIGCTASATASVTGVGVELNTNILTVNSACTAQGASAAVVSLDPTDNLTYSWTASSPNVQFSSTTVANPTINGPVGNYMVSVTVTNQFNCATTLTENLEIVSSVDLSAAIDMDVCNGLSVAFTNTSGLAGVWNFGDNSSSALPNPTHTYATAGNYTVTFTPNNTTCANPYSSPINVSATPAVNALATASLSACQGNSGTITFTDATQHNAAIASWNWAFQPGGSSTQQNPTLNVNQAGTVTAVLTVTDINGCTDASAPVTVPVTFVDDSLEQPAAICTGSSVSLNGSNNNGYIYNWTASPADPSLNNTAANPSVSPTQTTVYTAVISNGACSVTATATVTVNPAASIQGPADQTACEGNSLSLTANSPDGNNFAWSNSPDFNDVFANGPTATVTPANGGMIYVRIANGAGCTATDSVMVAYASVAAEADPAELTICEPGATAQLSISNKDVLSQLTYVWSNGLPDIANPTVNPTATTTYSVIVTNQFGCKDTLSILVNVVNITLSIEIAGKDTICEGETAQLLLTPTGGGPYLYNWSPASSLSDASAQSPIASPDATTDYFVTVTDQMSGCEQTSNRTLNVMALLCEEPFLFVPNAFTPNGDNNNDFFRVRGGSNIQQLEFYVWSRWGEKMYETTDPSALGWDGTFKGVACTPDAYAWYVKVICPGGQEWIKKGNVTLLK
jgi:gliding motility-associated-like protein